jgi:hypothetical protein
MSDGRIVAPFLQRLIDVLAALAKAVVDRKVKFSQGRGPRFK